MKNHRTPPREPADTPCVDREDAEAPPVAFDADAAQPEWEPDVDAEPHPGCGAQGSPVAASDALCRQLVEGTGARTTATPLLEVLAEDRVAIPYRRVLKWLTGSVPAAILLEQAIYWGARSGGRFFKFKEPPARRPGETEDAYLKRVKPYRPGDSWCEELGFSRNCFDAALRLIATRGRTLTPDSNPVAVDEGGSLKALRRRLRRCITYFTDVHRVTYYSVDLPALERVIKQAYVNPQQGFTQRPIRALSITEITSRDYPCLSSGKELEEREILNKKTTRSASRSPTLPERGSCHVDILKRIRTDGGYQWSSDPRQHQLFCDFVAMAQNVDPFITTDQMDRVFDLILREQLDYRSGGKPDNGQNLYRVLLTYLQKRYTSSDDGPGPERFLRFDIIRSHLTRIGVNGITSSRNLMDRLLGLDTELKRSGIDPEDYLIWVDGYRQNLSDHGVIPLDSVLGEQTLSKFQDSDAADVARLACDRKCKAVQHQALDRISRLAEAIQDRGIRGDFLEFTDGLTKRVTTGKLEPGQAYLQAVAELNRLKQENRKSFFA